MILTLEFPDDSHTLKLEEALWGTPASHIIAQGSQTQMLIEAKPVINSDSAWFELVNWKAQVPFKGNATMQLWLMLLSGNVSPSLSNFLKFQRRPYV